MILLSHYQAKQILDAYTRGEKEILVSLDLGITTSTISREKNDFLFPDGQRLMVKLITKILGSPQVCFLVENNSIHKVQTFSEETNRFYKLVPVGPHSPPTVELSGIRMHVTKAMDTLEHTKRMIREISPVEGIVLDTCRGLGYTVIEALRVGAKQIVSLEKDPHVTEIAKYNPYSQELFDNPNIELIDKDATLAIKKFKSSHFSRILHDPPTISIAGELYSQQFYDELFRVLAPGGILYHYTGNPGSKVRGMDIVKNVSTRLKKSGFRKVEKAHYGVRAFK